MVNIICLSKEKMTTQKVDSIDILAQTLLSESLSKNMYKMHSQNFVLCELKRMAKRHFRQKSSSCENGNTTVVVAVVYEKCIYMECPSRSFFSIMIKNKLSFSHVAV